MAYPPSAIPYTTTELITNAFYHSKIRSRNFDTISGDDIEVGLDQLNKILAQKTLSIAEIPYYTQLDFNLTAGKSQYFIPNLIQVDTITFFINGPLGANNVVRYSMGKQSRAQFFGSPRAMNIQSLPFNWHTERTYNTDLTLGAIGGGSNLFLYFVPNQAYPMEIWGLFSLANVALGQDLSKTLDLFYVDFLEFQLGERLCNVYDFLVPEGVTKELERMYKVLSKQSAQMDLKVLKMTTLDSRNSTLNYADANLGYGWRP